MSSAARAAPGRSVSDRSANLGCAATFQPFATAAV